MKRREEEERKRKEEEAKKKAEAEAKKKAKEAEGSDGDPKPAKQKKVKEIKGVTRGRKLTLAERWHGCVLEPVEPEKAKTAEDEAN